MHSNIKVDKVGITKRRIYFPHIPLKGDFDCFGNFGRFTSDGMSLLLDIVAYFAISTRPGGRRPPNNKALATVSVSRSTIEPG
jgi:hypothetical protein